MTDPLIVDLYAGDLGGKPDLGKLAAAGLPWSGVVLKATEGLRYDGGAWLRTYWPLAKSVAGARYGVTWRRGAYHYLRFDQDPTAQANFYLDTIDRAGGWVAGDFSPIVDVERAGNPDSSAAEIIAAVSSFVDVVARRTGREVILYGGSLLAGKGITSHMGCTRLWIARYTATLPEDIYRRIGWTVEQLFGWQYAGDGTGYLADYPQVSPIGRCDISALVNGLQA